MPLPPRKKGDGIAVGWAEEGDPEASGTPLLLAVGTRANTETSAAGRGHRPDKKGFIEVDEALRTSNPAYGRWATGNGKGAFTHTAYNELRIVATIGSMTAGRKWTDRIAATRSTPTTARPRTA